MQKYNVSAFVSITSAIIIIMTRIVFMTEPRRCQTKAESLSKLLVLAQFGQQSLSAEC